jgi:hypothetical protein
VKERSGVRFRFATFASIALGVSAIGVFPPRIAHANGRFPTAQQLAPSPSDPTFLPMMATFGVVISDGMGSFDGGPSWGWVCEKAVGYQPTENPTLGVTANNTVLVSTFEGLGLTTDRGCTWTIGAGGLKSEAVDLVVEPSDRHSALVLTTAYGGEGDAGPAYDTRIYVTHDDGTTFAQVGSPLDPSIVAETIDVAPSDSKRVYVSGTRRHAGVPVGVLLRSTDGGQTFAELSLASDDAGANDIAPYIAAVDPANPDRVYVRVDNVGGTRILVSDDGLATTHQVWQANGQILGFALSTDGSKVYLGGPDDGLYVTSSSALAFTTQAWPGQVQCLAFDRGRLLACSNEASGFAVGASTDDGATWIPLLHLGCVQGPLACAASSPVTMQCGPDWATQQTALGACTPNTGLDAGGPGGLDAGVPSAGDAGDGGKSVPPSSSPPPGSKGGGCATTSPAEGTDPALLGGGLVFASLLVIARRRRIAR